MPEPPPITKTTCDAVMDAVDIADVKAWRRQARDAGVNAASTAQVARALLGRLTHRRVRAS
jgi:hypothetical protein